MTKFKFSDERCKKLYHAAAPVGHYAAFAWRESPKTLDNHWKRDTAGMSPEDKDDLLKTCLLAGEAQSKYRAEQQRSGEKLHRPKGIAVWFNAGGQYQEIGSHADLKEKQQARQCSLCERPVHGSRYQYCTYHVEHDERGRLRDNMAFVDELRAAYKQFIGWDRERCVKFIKINAGKIGKT